MSSNREITIPHVSKSKDNIRTVLPPPPLSVPGPYASGPGHTPIVISTCPHNTYSGLPTPVTGSWGYTLLGLHTTHVD